jgi:hypothetical protein
MRIVKSTKAGWEKIGKSHYRKNGVEVRRGGSGWEVTGGASCGYVYGTMWAAMDAADRTPTYFAK